MVPADHDVPLGSDADQLSSEQFVAEGAPLLASIPVSERIILTTPRPIARGTPTVVRCRTPWGRWELVVAPEAYAAWPGYVFAILGRIVPAPHNGLADWPYLLVSPRGGGPTLVVQLWYAAAARAGAPFYARLTWAPGYPVDRSVRELAPRWHLPHGWDADFMQAGDAMRLLHLLQRPPSHAGGAPRMGDEEALDEAVRWAAEYLHRHPDVTIYDIGRPELQEVSFLSLDGFEHRMERKHVTLKKIRRRARELWGVLGVPWDGRPPAESE
jgi:hypothetical protein